MKKRHKGLFVSTLLAAIFVVAFGCTFFIYQKQEKNAKAEDLTVVTSFYPMYIAALNVCDGVEGIHLENLSEPQTGCLHDYQLTPEDMKLLQTADVFIVNGGGIENFLTDVAKACPNLTIINASQGLDLIEDNAHAWMSIALHEKQVDNIAEGLAAADADHSKAYAKNAKAYQKKLQALKKQEEEMTQYTKGRSVVLFQEGIWGWKYPMSWIWTRNVRSVRARYRMSCLPLQETVSGSFLRMMSMARRWAIWWRQRPQPIPSM